MTPIPLVVLGFLTVATSNCPVDEAQRLMTTADEHRNWAELWEDILDTYSEIELRHASDTLTDALDIVGTKACDDNERATMLREQLQLRVKWVARKSGMLRSHIRD